MRCSPAGIATSPYYGRHTKFIHRVMPYRPDVKVILSSGYNEQEATNRFAGKGLAGFLQQPYTPHELEDKLADIFNKT